MRATGPTSGSKSTVKIGAKKDGKIVAAQGTFYLQAGALPGLADPRRGRLQLCALRHPERALGRLRRGLQPLQGRGLSRAGRADRRLCGRVRARRTRRSAEDGSAGVPPEERREARHQGRARPGLPAHRLCRDAGGREDASALQGAARHKLQGRGVASGFWFNAGGESSAQVNITEDGNVVVTTGHPDIGGSRAGIANICAELLGIDYRRVSVLIGDTADDRLLAT